MASEIREIRSIEHAFGSTMIRIEMDELLASSAFSADHSVKEALFRVKKVLEVNPDALEVRLQRAVVRKAENKPGEYEKEVRDLYRQVPNHPDVFMLARTFASERLKAASPPPEEPSAPD